VAFELKRPRVSEKINVKKRSYLKNERNVHAHNKESIQVFGIRLSGRY
jgi:hypothetical protein